MNRLTESSNNNQPLDALLDAAVDAMIIADDEAGIIRVNAAALKMFGYSEQELVGKNVSTLMPEPDRSRHDSYIRHYRDGGAPAIIGIGREVLALHADGNTFPIHLSVGEITGQEAARFVAIIRDLSEQQATQDIVLELETQLAHADRLVILGELTAGIAHEINQPLTAIAAFADAGARLLTAHTPESDDELQNVCRRISEQARRAGNVVNRLRTLSRRGELTKSSHNIETMLRNVLLLFDHELSNSSIKLKTEFEPGLPIMIVDEIQIQQVLVNLIKNSIDALKSDSPQDPVINVRARMRDTMLEIDVRDNGPGVPAKFIDRLFEPFYTTKTQGVGLGLSICKNIAIAHGGKLTFHHPAEGGARFKLSLPTSYIG